MQNRTLLRGVLYFVTLVAIEIVVCVGGIGEVCHALERVLLGTVGGSYGLRDFWGLDLT